MINITTDRLIIISMSYAMVNSVLHGDDLELEKLGISTNGKWPLQDTLDILHLVANNMPKNGEPDEFDVWMIIKKADMTIIGDCGFKGGPDENGAIEIGFGIISEEWRRGYGFEAANALIKWAFSQNGVRTIKADCLPDNIGSVRVLEKCGMHEIKRDNEWINWEIANPNIVE